MSDRLLLFTIGPVGSVINSSRKMRDLYAGSYLLSHLTKSAVDYLKTEKDVEVILPLAESGNVPNRILAKVGGRDQAGRKRLAQAMEQTVRNRFRAIWGRLFGALGIESPAAQAQLERFPEVFWVYDELSGDSVFTSHITEKMQGIKGLRPFSQTQEPAGRKCALFPAYNALFIKRNSKDVFPKFTSMTGVVDVFDISACKYALKPSEGLSALAFVKRMMNTIREQLPEYNQEIPSIAYILLKNRLKTDPEAMELLPNLKDEASEAVFDLQNSQKLSEKEYSEDSITGARELYEKLKRDKVKVSPYYALVKFDGDGIGEIYQKCTIQEQHALSREISDYASGVCGTIEQYNGVCIYAGGEDFLGVLPLNTLVPAILMLRRSFQSKLHPPAKHAKLLTFSAGIVVAHLMQPLNEVLTLADQMEAYAKENEDGDKKKDSFAVSTVKRAGPSLKIRNFFGDDGINLSVLWETACNLIQKSYSAASVYQLAVTLKDLAPSAPEVREGMVRALIRQSFASPRSIETGTRDKRLEAADGLFRLYCQFGHDIQSFSDALETACFWGKEIAPCITK